MLFPSLSLVWVAAQGLGRRDAVPPSRWGWRVAGSINVTPAESCYGAGWLRPRTTD